MQKGPPLSGFLAGMTSIPFSAGCPRRQLRCLKRQLSLPISTRSQWWVMRSSSAVVIFGSPKMAGHSPKARLRAERSFPAKQR